jgi:transcriptional antiterminator Rof (Rho-off)
LFKLFGKAKMKEVEKLYAEAIAIDAMDAMECLDVEAARAEME